ncbi:hypothetical protein K457DRAFT_133439 [Linnemannia elongata AG-77]|uniref:Secreted protein n=1 Tax=Linnemannia elongata AG-77 TaxID=1314771 RepID=A0A197KCI9_9FUNG|nr:hypothetical protein K457DRAFT_133439 [Linnemannia elongata AG-77]
MLNHVKALTLSLAIVSASMTKHRVSLPKCFCHSSHSLTGCVMHKRHQEVNCPGHISRERQRQKYIFFIRRGWVLFG